MVTVDPDIRYRDDPQAWATSFVPGEMKLVKTALGTEQSLRKVMQFKPQIAAQATEQAAMALLLSWAMIVAYIWIRFGRLMYGVGGVVALIHDVLLALAFVGFSGWIANTTIGRMLLVEDFKINMVIVAALLTIIGYSVNDTIVVFDRIRETRGRLGIITPEIVNASINQTLSRTLMTVFTVFVVIVIAYIFGGSSIRGFNYCMLIGVLTGCYSSIAIASPLLLAHLHLRRTALVPARA
jgi:SecD/SecF fusion protein